MVIAMSKEIKVAALTIKVQLLLCLMCFFFAWPGKSPEARVNLSLKPLQAVAGTEQGCPGC